MKTDCNRNFFFETFFTRQFKSFGACFLFWTWFFCWCSKGFQINILLLIGQWYGPIRAWSYASIILKTHLNLLIQLQSYFLGSFQTSERSKGNRSFLYRSPTKYFEKEPAYVECHQNYYRNYCGAQARARVKAWVCVGVLGDGD